MLSFFTRRLARTSPRRPAFRLVLETLEDRLVPSLSTIPSTITYPYGTAVEMVVDFQGHTISCSGALIDGTHILTAAHCLYSSTYGMADSVTIYPGRDGANVEPFGALQGTGWVVHPSYVSGPYAGQSAFDLGLVSIGKDLSNSAGYLGVDARYTDSYFNNGGTLSTLEYPADTHSGVNQFAASGPALAADTNQVYWLLNNIPVEHGSSGAPVYVTASDGSRYIVAVVSELSPTEGIGTRITGSKLNWIVSEIDNTPESAPPPPPTGPFTPGIFDPQSGTWYLRNSTTAGGADAGSFAYGGPGWKPVVGDWNGDGVSTVGVVSGSATWYLRDSNSPGAASVTPFAYGMPNWIPVVGDWNGDSATTIGMFDPTTATWYLRNENSAGAPDITPFQYGAPGWIPVVGDWNGDGTTTIGIVDPKTMTWYLRNENSPGAPDFTPFQYGGPGWTPIVGDWNGDGTTTIGVVDPTTETWYPRDANSAGPPSYMPFAYGAPGWIPLSGNWLGIPSGVPAPTTQIASNQLTTDAALYAIATANTTTVGNSLLLTAPSAEAGNQSSDQSASSETSADSSTPDTLLVQDGASDPWAPTTTDELQTGLS